MGTTLPRILVVEDDPFLMKIYKVKLSKIGFEVITAVDGEEALAKAKEPGLKLILLDLILPKTDGFEVLKQLKESPATKAIPVMITSNLGQASDIEKAKTLGATEYLVKNNISINDLVEKAKAVAGLQ